MRNTPSRSQNPYAPPKSDVSVKTATVENGRVFRKKKTIYLLDGAELPPRCIKCNAPAEQPIKERTLHWHHPAWYLLILFNIIIYAVAAVLVRKKIQLHIGLCAEHARQRTRDIWITCGALVLGVLLIIAGIQIDAITPAAMIFGCLLILFSLIYAIARLTLLIPSKIADGEVRLTRAGKAFLESLPEQR